MPKVGVLVPFFMESVALSPPGILRHDIVLWKAARGAVHHLLITGRAVHRLLITVRAVHHLLITVRAVHHLLITGRAVHRLLITVRASSSAYHS